MGRMSETLTGSGYAITDWVLTNLCRGFTAALEGGSARTCSIILFQSLGNDYSARNRRVCGCSLSHSWSVGQTMPAPKQTWKLSSNRQFQASWFSHRTASSLMRTAIGPPRSRKRHRTEFIAFASFARILLKTSFSRSLLMLFSQLRAASSRPLSWHSKARNHNPCRNDLTLNFETRP